MKGILIKRCRVRTIVLKACIDSVTKKSNIDLLKVPYIHDETFERCSFLFKFKEYENFNHRNIKEYFGDNAKASLRAKFEPD